MLINLWNNFCNILLLASTLSVCPSCLEQCLLRFRPLCSVLYMAIPPTLCKGWYGTLLAAGEKHYAQLKVWGTPSGPPTSGFIFSQLMLPPVEVPCEATSQGPRGQNLGSSGDGGPSKNIVWWRCTGGDNINHILPSILRSDPFHARSHYTDLTHILLQSSTLLCQNKNIYYS